MFNFDQDGRLSAFDWERVLPELIRRYGLNFIKLELLMLFYRRPFEPLRTEEIVARTGYHLREVTQNLTKLSADGLLQALTADGETRYARIESTSFAGRSLLWQTLQRLVDEFNAREGRLRIIYALLTSHEEREV
jgi:DNA-binding MarR family transcriptional regulator